MAVSQLLFGEWSLIGQVNRQFDWVIMNAVDDYGERGLGFCTQLDVRGSELFNDLVNINFLKYLPAGLKLPPDKWL